MSRLDKINGPADLHGLSDEELQEVAQEVRELIIDTIGEIGGAVDRFEEGHQFLRVRM